MPKTHEGNYDVIGEGELVFWVGKRRKRPDLWECFFVDGLDDHCSSNCSNHPKDCVTICIEVETEEHDHTDIENRLQKNQYHICRISWKVTKPRKIFWRIIHFD